MVLGLLVDNLLAHNITETNQSYDVVYINKCLFHFDLHQHYFHFIFNNLYNTTRISIRTKGGIIHLNKTDVAAFSEGIRGPGVGVEETTVRPTELQSEYQTRYHL